MQQVLLAIFSCVVALFVGEFGLRQTLFKQVSYSNSESIDRQLHDRDAENDWNILFIGDSETRWGVNPGEIDLAFSVHGIQSKSFNHAFDGFGAPWWSRLLPNLLKEPSLKRVKEVVLGVQLIASHHVINASNPNCGALQKPVLTSPFAKDLGVEMLCRNQSWDSRLSGKIFGGLWTVRYASAIRSLILPEFMKGGGNLRFNSRKHGESYRGFVPHRSIAEERDTYDHEFARWKAQYQPSRDFVPLPQAVWPEMTLPNGFFDELNRVVLNSGRKLVLFALPTNPVVIDTFNRRSDYIRNSKLLTQWAEGRSVVFVDLGIQDVANPEDFFSDMRHLSGEGARLYSRKLGDMLVKRGVLEAQTRDVEWHQRTRR